MANPLVQARSLVKTFDTPAGPLNVLRGIDLDIQKSDFVALVGPSGKCVQYFHELREQGRTVIVVTHDRELIYDVPRIIVLSDGLIEATTLEAAAKRCSQELSAARLRIQERRKLSTQRLD